MDAGSGWSDLATALGLVLVIEGLLMALAPEAMKRLVAEILARPAHNLRFGGVVAVALGVAVVWLARG
jgi:hypothetical protein